MFSIIFFYEILWTLLFYDVYGNNLMGLRVVFLGQPYGF